jgi:hypothetical protein
MKTAHILLSRDAFREAVFSRDKGTCVFCIKPAVDAHHILERRLWPDGGYYLDNGASVCGEHHLACEATTLSVEDVRLACGITKPVIPPHLYDDQPYDKWGNPVMPNGQRLKGELFDDESVQKILGVGQVLHLFIPYVKYNRTYHVPWSQSMNDDDRMMSSLDAFQGQRVIVTEKMDGENTSMYRDHIHTRSIDSRNHPSRNWVKSFWSGISGDIPDGWRICGENLYAKHSIGYTDLSTYFMGFSIWDDRNMCLEWDRTMEWFELFGITPVPVLYDGIYDEKVIKALWKDSQWEVMEGYVVRLAASFHYTEFRHKVGKFVRAKHVQTSKHWMYGRPIERNLLASEKG